MKISRICCPTTPTHVYIWHPRLANVVQQSGDIHDSESGMLLQCPSPTTGVQCVDRFMTDFKGDTEKAKAASRWGQPGNLKLRHLFGIVWHMRGKRQSFCSQKPRSRVSNFCCWPAGCSPLSASALIAYQSIG